MTLLQAQTRTREIVEHMVQRGVMTNKLLAAQSKLGSSQVSSFRHGRKSASLQSLSRILTAVGFGVELLPIADRRSPIAIAIAIADKPPQNTGG